MREPTKSDLEQVLCDLRQGRLLIFEWTDHGDGELSGRAWMIAEAVSQAVDKERLRLGPVGAPLVRGGRSDG